MTIEGRSSEFYFVFTTDNDGEVDAFRGTYNEITNIDDEPLWRLEDEVKKLPDNIFGGRKVWGTMLYTAFNDKPMTRGTIFYVPQICQFVPDERRKKNESRI